MAKYPGQGELLDKASLIRFVGISAQTLEYWIQQGCPVALRGKQGKRFFNSKDVLKWRELRDAKRTPHGGGSAEVVSLARERARMERVKREHAELKLARDRGEYVARKDVLEAWGQVLTRIRQHLLMIPHRVAPRVYDVQSIPEIEEELKEAVHEILSELADTHVEYRTGGDDQEVDEPDASAAEAEGERVGRSAPLAQPRNQRRAGEVED